MSMSKQRAPSLILAYLVLGIGAVIALTPLLWMVSSSFKTGGEIFSPPPSVVEAKQKDPNAHPGALRIMADLLTPRKPTWDNYVRLFKEKPFGQYFVNSLFIATSLTLLTLLFSTMGGFAFAKYRFAGRDALFWVVLGSMMIPFQVLLVPLFALMDSFRWFDTYTAIIIPFSASAFGTFLMRQYILSVPSQMLDAARIDGCSDARIYWDIVLPVIKPALGALTIFAFMNSWNNFLWPLIVLRSESKYTLPLGLAGLVGVYSQEYGMLMAGTLISTLPIVLLFLAMQREFVSGITLGAVKE
jgi:ABC-type glycerol-3-phosphate transport system permease component